MSKPASAGERRIEPLLDFLGRAELLGGVAEGLFGAMPPAPLDGVADGADQQVVVDLAFDQVVLGTGLDRLDGRRLVVVAGEHDDRHVGGVGVHGEEGFQPAAVGQGQVEEDHVEGVLGAALHARREQLHVHQLEGAVPAVAQEVAHDPDVVGIVFHQQDSDVVDAAMIAD